MQNCYGSILEPLAWRFLTILYRRHHRKLAAITEMHPGGGLYDVRALSTPTGSPVVLLNLRGSLNAHGQRNELSLRPDEVWRRLGAPRFGGLLDEVSQVLGWPEDKGEPTPVWTYRFISSFLQAGALHRPAWRCAMEQQDDSSGGSGPRGFVDQFPGARKAYDEWSGPLLFDSPGYFFWALLRDEVPTLLVDTTGRLWSQTGLVASLPDLARASGYRTWEMTTRAAGAWLE